jgi:hypothetical protein
MLVFRERNGQEWTLRAFKMRSLLCFECLGANYLDIRRHISQQQRYHHDRTLPSTDSDIRNTKALLEGSKFSAIFPLVININTVKEHCWNYNNKKKNRSTQRKLVSEPLSPSQISQVTGPGSNPRLRSEKPTANHLSFVPANILRPEWLVDNIHLYTQIYIHVIHIVLTWQRARCVSIRKTSRRIINREIIAVYWDTPHRTHYCTVRTKYSVFSFKPTRRRNNRLELKG